VLRDQPQPEPNNYGRQIAGERFQEFATRLQTSATKRTRVRSHGANLLSATRIDTGLPFTGHR
jgi:hypothetical protein